MDTSAFVTSDFDLKITSDEFIYLNIRRDYYKQLRDAFEIKKAASLPSPVDTTTTTITTESNDCDEENGDPNQNEKGSTEKVDPQDGEPEEEPEGEPEQNVEIEPERETDEKSNLLA